ncbi:MAG TPA: universal stress protein [Candidatus Acidoferrales bacterium]|nr:universal stress protein [Candidatus Acidoferrales bacterium]
MTIQKILFPVDFSPSCEAMAPFVKWAAELLSARVTLLYVLEASASGFELLSRPLREAVEDQKQAARKKLHSFLAREFPAETSARLVLVGSAANRIAESAREHAFDLITMPTHAGAFRRMLLGSTTAKVLNDADCPVLTTQHAETISPRPLGPREILCAIGLQEDSARVLRFASQTAEAVHANLTLVHVIPASEPGSPVRLNLEEPGRSAEGQAARRRIEKLQTGVGSRARIRIVAGPLKDSLIDAARRLRADVLAIGRSPQPGSLGRLRDLTYAMVRDAPCPVLSV